MIAYHTVGLIPRQLPNRKFTPLSEHRQHRLNEMGSPLPLDYCHKRMKCPVCVPQREYSIMLISLSLVYLPVHPSVFTVNIREQIWCNRSMVKSCIKSLKMLFIAAFNLYFSQKIVPCPLCFLLQPLKVPSVALSLQIQFCIIG